MKAKHLPWINNFFTMIMMTNACLYLTHLTQSAQPAMTIFEFIAWENNSIEHVKMTNFWILYCIILDQKVFAYV